MTSPTIFLAIDLGGALVPRLSDETEKALGEVQDAIAKWEQDHVGVKA